MLRRSKPRGWSLLLSFWGRAIEKVVAGGLNHTMAILPARLNPRSNRNSDGFPKFHPCFKSIGGATTNPLSAKAFDIRAHPAYTSRKSNLKGMSFGGFCWMCSDPANSACLGGPSSPTTGLAVAFFTCATDASAEVLSLRTVPHICSSRSPRVTAGPSSKNSATGGSANRLLQCCGGLRSFDG